MLVGKNLYRALLRQANLLPDSAATSHYRSLIRTSFSRETQSDPESSNSPEKRTQQAQRLLRQLQAANDGYLHSLTRVLDHTYARRGPGKHELLRPFTLSPTSASPNNYAFSPPLAALLTSPIAHTSRPPSRHNLSNPPSLPPRADPSSEEARLLGPLIPQRIRQLRRRYWTAQVGKLRAPIAVLVHGVDGQLEQDVGRAKTILEEVGLGRVEVQGGWDRLRELEQKAQVPLEDVRRLPRRLQTREQRATPGPTLTPRIGPPRRSEDTPQILSPSSKNSKWHLPKTLSPRLLRRRYREILADAPIFVVGGPAAAKGIERGEGARFRVTNSEWAKGGVGTVGLLSEEDLWWMEREEVADSGRRPAKPKGGKLRGAKPTS